MREHAVDHRIEMLRNGLMPEDGEDALLQEIVDEARQKKGIEESPAKENHKSFLRHLKDSEKSVDFVRQYLLEKGYAVLQNPSTKAESHADWKQHADNGDLYIQQRIEVKHLSIDFTKTDWPYKDFIVCAKHSFDNAKPKPFAYFVLSKSKRFAAILIVSETQSKWFVSRRRDRRYEGVEQEFYVAPIECAKFVSMEAAS